MQLLRALEFHVNIPGVKIDLDSGKKEAEDVTCEKKKGGGKISFPTEQLASLVFMIQKYPDLSLNQAVPAFHEHVTGLELEKKISQRQIKLKIQEICNADSKTLVVKDEILQLEEVKQSLEQFKGDNCPKFAITSSTSKKRAATPNKSTPNPKKRAPTPKQTTPVKQTPKKLSKNIKEIEDTGARKITSFWKPKITL